MMGVSAGELRGGGEDQAELVLPASLLRLARTLRKGGVQASFLLGSEGVSGFKIIRDPETTNRFEMQQELAALRERLEDALIVGDMAPSVSTDAVRGALARAATDLHQATAGTAPKAVPSLLAQAADHMIQASAQAQDTTDLTLATARLTVATVALWTVAERLMGVSG